MNTIRQFIKWNNTQQFSVCYCENSGASFIEKKDGTIVIRMDTEEISIAKSKFLDFIMSAAYAYVGYDDDYRKQNSEVTLIIKDRDKK